MERSDLLRAWGRILSGYIPALSVEVTKECPLSCPGCYAFQPEHLGGEPLTSLSDFRGEDLVRGVIELVGRHRPVVVYLVGGEPLVRYRELNTLLPQLAARRIHVRVVTSAVRPIPREWEGLARMGVVVSVDGLAPEHDQRRKPATYERILKHIEGHRVGIHCTVTRQMMVREGYLEEFVRFWSGRPEVGGIQVSFFTPQIGETSEEILTPEARKRAVADLEALRHRYPKLGLRREIVAGYLHPPENPSECIFARTTHCVSADLERTVEPCQFGGKPNCSECGCLASIALHAIGQHRLPGGVRLVSILDASERVGSGVRWVREKISALGGNGAPRREAPESSR